MRGTGIVTKLSKLDVSRIALCKSPADQDAVFVVVKSEDAPIEETAVPEEAPVPAEAPVVEETPAEAPAEPQVSQEGEPEVAKEESEIKMDIEGGSVLFKTSKRLSEEEIQEVIKQIRNIHCESAPVEKSPVLSESRTEEFSATTADDSMKDCIKGLVDKCNESRAVPKGVLKMIGEVAKYHGVEGPDMEGEDAFVEVTAQLRAVVDILKGLAITIAKPAPSAPPEAASAPAAKPKPAPAKKSIETVRKEALEEVRFQLLKALGKDPCPPGE